MPTRRSSLVAGWPVFQTLSPVHAVGWLAALRLVTPLLLLVLAIVVLERWLRRLWCRSLCPQGGLLSFVARYAVLRVRVRAPRMPVAPCRRCTLACPVGIKVMEDHVLAGRDSIGEPECIRCGACVDACPRGVLRLGFRATRGAGRCSSSRRWSAGLARPLLDGAGPRPSDASPSRAHRCAAWIGGHDVPQGGLVRNAG